jgi:hypothetical protein
MARTLNRPGVVVAAAVILMIVSILTLLGGICGGGIMAFTAAAPEPKGEQAKQPFGDAGAQQRFIAKEAPAYYAVIFSLTGLGVLLSAGQLLAAIGLLSMNPTARTAAIWLTAAKLFVNFLGHVYNAVYVMPAQRDFFDQNPLPQGAPFDIGAFTQTLGSVMLVVVFLFQLAIGITIVGLLMTKSANDGFAAATAPPVEEEKPRSKYEGYDDEGYNPPPPETGIQDRPS